ncbi:Arogenate dehydratase/prephenate dehydratase 6 [Forsythia ovata]|uniref:Arogenate dehydratase/prephenate dehydratase 6 n=1 Tax=Forsythia ovata TaxID=205694 RepID=A0ABD1WAE1_9LAMI
MGLNASRKAVDDTARAVEYIATNNLRNTTAIAYARAPKLYDLQTLAKRIQDDSSNVTRFVILSRAHNSSHRLAIQNKHRVCTETGSNILFKVSATRAHPSIYNPPGHGAFNTGGRVSPSVLSP